MNVDHSAEGWNRLDLNLFRVFDVVYAERSLSRAATVLCVTQSAVSHALSRLRDHLGDPLFTRQGRGVAPTPLAAQLAPAVREALSGLSHALLEGREFDPRRDVARVALALPDELEALLLPAVFARLQGSAPQVSLAAVRLERPQLRGDLAAGRFDVALDVAQPVEDDLRSERVLSDSFCVVTARKRRTLDREGYLAGRHVAVSSRRTGPALEDFRFGVDGVRRNVVVRCQRYETACRIVATSDLLLTMPRRLAEARRRSLDLRIFAPPLRIPGIGIHLYWHRRSDESPVSRWLRAELRSALAAPA